MSTVLSPAVTTLEDRSGPHQRRILGPPPDDYNRPGPVRDVSGTVTSDDADPAKGSVDITIGTASIDTREAQRDAHLRSADFFDVETFPTMTFRARASRTSRATASRSSAT